MKQKEAIFTEKAKMADQIGHLAEPGNLAVLDGEPGVAEHACLRHLGALLPQHALRYDPDEFANVSNQHHMLFFIHSDHWSLASGAGLPYFLAQV